MQHPHGLMPRQRIMSIEYIRGIAMLGVVGIHTGAYSLSNPDVNIHLFALLEIVSRFSVPIFFFVSAFGLFLHQDLNQPMQYGDFLKRRGKTVLLPYLIWSLLYMYHYSAVSGDTLIWEKPLIYEYFLFGLASYQLYFLVILMWFYMLMPLWRILVRGILKAPHLLLSILLVWQIAVNYYSSYQLDVNFSNPFLQLAIQYRVSYWVLHYIFIFLFGAVCAVQYTKWLNFFQAKRSAVISFFLLSLAGMLGLYYYLLAEGYSPEAAVNTAQQLSPPGVLYTVAATCFLLTTLESPQVPFALQQLLSHLGKHSYVVYLIHPLIMYNLISLLDTYHILLSPTVVICFYVLTVLLSLGTSQLIQQIGKFIPFVSLLLTGSTPKAKSNPGKA